jgi:hypothetical protein
LNRFVGDAANADASRQQLSPIIFAAMAAIGTRSLWANCNRSATAAIATSWRTKIAAFN